MSNARPAVTSRHAFGFLIPAVAGNTLGGVSLVAALAHAQFAERQPETA